MDSNFSFISVALWCGLVCGAAGQASAQIPLASSSQYLQTNWTTEEGLPQNSVNAIVQTRDGYLWLGTLGGLARFDGALFTVFEAGHATGLKSSRVLALAEDQAGVLWIGTERGGLTSFHAGRFRHWTTAEGLPGESVNAITPAREGGLWIGTEGGLARFRDGRFQVYTTKDGLPRTAVYALCEDPQGNLWIGTQGGLTRFAQGSFTTYPTKASLVHDYVHVIHADRAGNLWVGAGAEDAGLSRFEQGKLIPYKPPDGRPISHVEALHEDAAGNLWIGTWRQGLLRLKDDRLSRFTTQDGLAVNYVKSVLQDREGNLWIGTNPGGLHCWRSKKMITYTTDDGLAFNGVIPVLQDSQGTIWVGSSCGGLNRIRDGKVTVYTEKDGLPQNCIDALFEDRDGNLWIGTGLSLTRFRDGKFTNYTEVIRVRAILQDPDGSLWLGTPSGLYRFRDGRFTAYDKVAGLGRPDIRCLLRDRQGALWLGTMEGLIRFRQGQVTRYTTREGLSHHMVMDIYEDADGVLWLGTYSGGLCRFKEGRFAAITTQHGLLNNAVFRILEDARGNFWMSSMRGIQRVSRSELNELADGKRAAITCVSYGVADGMKSSETTGGRQPAGWKARDGKLWFPTIKGVVAIDPEQINPLPPPVFIERVRLDREALPAAPTVQIGPDYESLEIHYTGLSFSRPEQVKFKYRMAGLEQSWTDAGTRRIAYYSYLPPGSYTFRVIATNGDGVWNNAGAALRIVSVPPFWRTWWFATALLAGLGGVTWFFYQRRIAQLQRRQAEQEAFARRLIDSQESERKRIAAELHDSLGQSLIVIKNRVQLSLQELDDRAEMEQQLAIISTASSQALAELKEVSHNLRPYLLDRLGLLLALRAMLNKAAAAGRLQLTEELDPLEGVFAKESEIHLYRIVQECVNNVLKHAAATALQVRVEKTASQLVLTVADNGQGFAPAQTDTSAPAQSFGLLGLAERVRLLGGTHSIESAPRQGTTVRIQLTLKEGRHGS